MGHLAAVQSKMKVFALSVVTLTLLLAAQQGQAKAVHAQVTNITDETSAHHDGPNNEPGDDNSDVKKHMANKKEAPTQHEPTHGSDDDDKNAVKDKDSQHEKDQKNDNSCQHNDVHQFSKA